MILTYIAKTVYVHFVPQSKTVLAILVQGHLSNIPMKFKLNRPRGIGGVDV